MPDQGDQPKDRITRLDASSINDATQQPVTKEDLLGVVDPAALAMAAVAGSIAFVLGSGDWTPVTTVIGLTLLLVVLAYHRGVLRTPRSRNVMGRAAFGGVTALSICLAGAWIVQEALVAPSWDCHTAEDWGFTRICADDTFSFIVDRTAGGITTGLVTMGWIALMPILAILEPRITRRLGGTT